MRLEAAIGSLVLLIFVGGAFVGGRHLLASGPHVLTQLTAPNGDSAQVCIRERNTDDTYLTTSSNDSWSPCSSREIYDMCEGYAERTYFRWISSAVVEVWVPKKPGMSVGACAPINLPKNLKLNGIHLNFETYEPNFERNGPDVAKFTIDSNAFSATFASGEYPGGCDLKLHFRRSDGDAEVVSFRALPLSRYEKQGYMNQQLDVIVDAGKSALAHNGDMLTAVSVLGAKPMDEYPTGNGQHTVVAKFIEKQASSVLDRIESGYFDLSETYNFGEKEIRTNINASALDGTKKFLKCVGKI